MSSTDKLMRINFAYVHTFGITNRFKGTELLIKYFATPHSICILTRMADYNNLFFCGDKHTQTVQDTKTVAN